MQGGGMDGLFASLRLDKARTGTAKIEDGDAKPEAIKAGIFGVVRGTSSFSSPRFAVLAQARQV